MLRSDLNRQRPAHLSHNHKGKHGSQGKKNAGASLTFCWIFGIVVCAVFGLASFLMISAGHFDFESSSGVDAAWGGINGDENFVTGNLIKVEVTDLETPQNQTLYANAADNNLDVDKLEEFGPFPKYLSDYESIILTVNDDGTKIPENEEEEDEKEIAAMKLAIKEADEAAKIDVAEQTEASEAVESAESTDLKVAQAEEKEEVKEEQAAPILVENSIAWREHVVKNGETLSDIAASYGNITTQDILKANGLKDANKLAENQLLLIPNDSSKIDETFDEVRTRQMRVAAVKEKVEPIKVKSYMIAKGDSLWSIANSQNIEVDTLIGSNSFKSSSRLRPGATLRIPNQDGIFYTMKKGDTIEAVAKRYGVSKTKLRQVNINVDTANLSTGDEIFLPGAKPDGLLEHKKEEVKVAEVKKNEKTSKTTSAKTAKNERQTVRIPRSEVAVRNTGAFRWPIMGRINSPFGWRYHPITKRRDFHTGIDIKANRNDPIKAAAPGRVVYSGWMGGYGKVLVIEHHNGQSSLYAHCSSLLVGKGENVSSGKLIAKIGTTGRSTGPHLHFEIRNGNSPVNPIKYLNR